MDPMNEPPANPPLETEARAEAPWSKHRTSLGLRIAARLAVIFLVFGVVQFFVVQGITRSQFQAIERTNLQDRTRQVFQTFEREAAFLKTLTTAQAAWRDTYEYAIHPTQGYLDRNFGGDWPKTYDIDFVLMVAMDGRRIWSSDGYPTFQLRGPAALSAEQFLVNNPYIFPQGSVPKPTDVFIGMIGSHESAWIYCAHAITNDDLTAPPRGMMLFGRRIDKATLASYAFGQGDDLTLVSHDLAPFPQVSDDYLTVHSYPVFHASRTAIRVEGGQLVSYTPFTDLAGLPLAALRLSIPRTVEKTGDRLVWFTSLSLLTVAVITLGAILLAIRATVILPLSRLASFFTAQTEGREEILKVTAQRTDEIGILAERASALLAKIKEQHTELESQANTDRLTGLPNRRSFDAHINKELRRLLRHKRGNQKVGQMAVVVIDVDHFKLFNDTNGHMAGDVCLRAIAESIRSCISRAGDLACRFGGEEFILVLPDTDEAGALVVSESARAAVERIAVPHSTSPVASVITVSLGAAASEVGEGFQIEALIERADQALYAAKKAGRNRVVGSSSLKPGVDSTN